MILKLYSFIFFLKFYVILKLGKVKASYFIYVPFVSILDNYTTVELKINYDSSFHY